MQPVTSIEDLKKRAADGFDCFILLGGCMRSSKHIHYEKGQFHILNEIDGSTQTLTTKQLMDRRYTHIGYAMKHRCLFAY